MRPSSKIQILRAAVRVTERHGITALTLDAAAEEAGLTKAGLMYHFRTRDALLIAIQRHLTETWEKQLLVELGKPLEESTAQERAAAYVASMRHGSASKAELAFMVESATSSELAQVWERPDGALGAPAVGARSGTAGPVPRAAGRRRPVAVRGDQAVPPRPRGQGSPDPQDRRAHRTAGLTHPCPVPHSHLRPEAVGAP